MNEGDVDEDEQLAGIHKLSAFGPFGTMDYLTKGDLSKHDTFWNMPANKIYTKLLYDKVARDIEKDLKKIKEAQSNERTKR